MRLVVLATRRVLTGIMFDPPMHRRLFLRAAAFAPLLPALAISADNRWQSPRLVDHPLVGKVWGAAEHAFVPLGAVIARLRHAHFRLFGEVHDNPDHHALQAKLLDAVGAMGLAPRLALEQFDREHDAVLQERQRRSGIGAEDVADAVAFDRRGWNWDFYRPLVAIALRYGMEVRAANLSRAAAAKIARQGLSALDPARMRALHLESAWDSARETALREVIRAGHCGALPESAVPSMTAAQRVRDATLAEALLGSGPDGAVLIAGNGHVRRDLGVPLYLAAAAAEQPLCAVGILEVVAGRDDPDAYVAPAAGRTPQYDFACFTPRSERPDPCAAFGRWSKIRRRETVDLTFRQSTKGQNDGAAGAALIN